MSAKKTKQKSFLHPETMDEAQYFQKSLSALKQTKNQLSNVAKQLNKQQEIQPKMGFFQQIGNKTATQDTLETQDREPHTQQSKDNEKYHLKQPQRRLTRAISSQIKSEKVPSQQSNILLTTKNNKMINQNEVLFNQQFFNSNKPTQSTLQLQQNKSQLFQQGFSHQKNQLENLRYQMGHHSRVSFQNNTARQNNKESEEQEEKKEEKEEKKEKEKKSNINEYNDSYLDTSIYTQNRQLQQHKSTNQLTSLDSLEQRRRHENEIKKQLELKQYDQELASEEEKDNQSSQEIIEQSLRDKEISQFDPLDTIPMVRRDSNNPKTGFLSDRIRNIDSKCIQESIQTSRKNSNKPILSDQQIESMSQKYDKSSHLSSQNVQSNTNNFQNTKSNFNNKSHIKLFFQPSLNVNVLTKQRNSNNSTIRIPTHIDGLIFDYSSPQKQQIQERLNNVKKIQLADKNFSSVLCKVCNEVILESEYADHSRECASTKIQCRFCFKKISRNRMNTHFQQCISRQSQGQGQQQLQQQILLTEKQIKLSQQQQQLLERKQQQQLLLFMQQQQQQQQQEKLVYKTANESNQNVIQQFQDDNSDENPLSSCSNNVSKKGNLLDEHVFNRKQQSFSASRLQRKQSLMPYQGLTPLQKQQGNNQNMQYSRVDKLNVNNNPTINYNEEEEKKKFEKNYLKDTINSSNRNQSNNQKNIIEAYQQNNLTQKKQNQNLLIKSPQNFSNQSKTQFNHSTRNSIQCQSQQSNNSTEHINYQPSEKTVVDFKDLFQNLSWDSNESLVESFEEEKQSVLSQKLLQIQKNNPLQKFLSGQTSHNKKKENNQEKQNQAISQEELSSFCSREDNLKSQNTIDNNPPVWNKNLRTDRSFQTNFSCDSKKSDECQIQELKQASDRIQNSPVVSIINNNHMSLMDQKRQNLDRSSRRSVFFSREDQNTSINNSNNEFSQINTPDQQIQKRQLNKSYSCSQTQRLKKVNSSSILSKSFSQETKENHHLDRSIIPSTPQENHKKQNQQFLHREKQHQEAKERRIQKEWKHREELSQKLAEKNQILEERQIKREQEQQIAQQAQQVLKEQRKKEQQCRQQQQQEEKQKHNEEQQRILKQRQEKVEKLMRQRQDQLEMKDRFELQERLQNRQEQQQYQQEQIQHQQIRLLQERRTYNQLSNRNQSSLLEQLPQILPENSLESSQANNLNQQSNKNINSCNDTIPPFFNVTYLSSELEEKCSICLDDFKYGEELAMLQCTHKFHIPCISDWIKKKRQCPLDKSCI